MNSKPADDEYRKALGQAAENEAARLLVRKGMKILERNWRGGGQEVDIIARDGDTLVFVEVRARKAGGKLSAVESISPAKQRTMRKGAEQYLLHTDQWEKPCRIDIVVAENVACGGISLKLEHFVNVI